jgi:hypothetical protein
MARLVFVFHFGLAWCASAASGPRTSEYSYQLVLEQGTVFARESGPQWEKKVRISERGVVEQLEYWREVPIVVAVDGKLWGLNFSKAIFSFDRLHVKGDNFFTRRLDVRSRRLSEMDQRELWGSDCLHALLDIRPQRRVQYFLRRLFQPNLPMFEQ